MILRPDKKHFWGALGIPDKMKYTTSPVTIFGKWPIQEGCELCYLMWCRKIKHQDHLEVCQKVAHYSLTAPYSVHRFSQFYQHMFPHFVLDLEFGLGLVNRS